MKLTGKAKEALAEWLKGSDDFYNTTVEHLENYPECMRFGVYVDFFDSVGIIVTIAPYHTNHLSEGIDTDGTFSIFIHDKNGNWIYDGVDFESKPEARTAAITKANDLFNER